MLLQVKYAGLRPVISQHGITFKDGKEDKYIYLATALEILKDIDNDYNDKKHYSYDINTQSLNQEQMHTMLQYYDSNLEEKVITEKRNYERKINEEIISVNNFQHISNIEKEVWCKNIKLMKDYRIQRAINKIYYIHCINDIKEIIIKKRIKEINTPFNEKFWHVLQTIQGAIETHKSSVFANIKEETDKNGNMIVTLNIIY